MQACDQLYGVTMQERGVSKHVAVKLEEIIHDEQRFGPTSAQVEPKATASTTSNGMTDQESPLIETKPTSALRKQLEEAWGDPKSN